MNRRAALSLALAPLALAQSNRQPFIGVWKLVSYTWTDKASGKTEEPFGPHPVGRITYDAAGRMSAQLMRPDRKSVGGSSNLGGVSAIRAASAEDLREMASGFVAYFGTFTVDEKAKIVTHHVEGALVPTWVGSRQRRSYEFSGDKLILSGAFDLATVRLTWQRQLP